MKREILRHAAHIKDIIGKVLVSVEQKNCSPAKYTLLEHWQEIIPKELVAYTHPQTIHQKTLIVTVTNSAYLHALTMRKREILRTMHKVIAPGTITDICFKIGAAPKKGD